MLQYKSSFDSLLWVKPTPNDDEKILFQRAEKYISRITWIPGLRMVAVVNSLSMYATHEWSDIDLFVITAKDRMWIVRVLMTLSFSLMWVWRYGEDIAGNFCLSFFIEEDAMDLSEIAIEDDIYLYFWIYYMKPVYVLGDTYERFHTMNWKLKIDNWKSGKQDRENSLWMFHKIIYYPLLIINSLIRYFWEKKARANYEKKWKPEGVIITRNILKFHDQDKRKVIRDTLLKGK